MATYSVNVYFNTGFNSINIPASKDVVRKAQVKHFNNSYYFREDLDKAYIDLKTTYSDVRDVDYVEMINNDTSESLFFFAVPSSLSKNTIRIFLEIDALTTMGGAVNLNYTDGWQTRGHIKKEEDVIFNNIYPEPFQPKKDLITSDLIDIHGTGTADDLSIVYTNTNLTLMATAEEGTEDTVEVYTGTKRTTAGEKEEVMYFPKVQSPKVATKFSIYDFKSKSYKSYNITGSAAYSMDSWVSQEAIEKMHSMGITDLTASYFVPGEFSATNPIINEDKGTSTAAVYGELKGINSTQTISLLPYQYLDNIKNKKVFSLYNNYILSNVASGSSISKNASELYNNDISPSVNIWSDMSPGGSPFARFSHIKTSDNQYDAVCTGAPWNNNQINLVGGSGSIWNSLSASFSQANIDRSSMATELDRSFAERTTNDDVLAYNRAMSAIGAGEGGLVSMNPMGIINDIMGSTFTIGSTLDAQLGLSNDKGIFGDFETKRAQRDIQQAKYNQQLDALRQQTNENALGEIRANKLVAPTALFSPKQSLSIYGYNYFVIQQLHLDPSDAERLDKFFQRFGYSGLERPLTSECFNCREYYTYVQAYNVNIKSTYGMRIRNKAIEQLNQGVRVWKVLPDSKYYDLN